MVDVCRRAGEAGDSGGEACRDTVRLSATSTSTSNFASHWLWSGHEWAVSSWNPLASPLLLSTFRAGRLFCFFVEIFVQRLARFSLRWYSGSGRNLKLVQTWLFRKVLENLMITPSVSVMRRLPTEAPGWLLLALKETPQDVLSAEERWLKTHDKDKEKRQIF